jgi:hypothetical protein
MTYTRRIQYNVLSSRVQLLMNPADVSRATAADNTRKGPEQTEALQLKWRLQI